MKSSSSFAHPTIPAQTLETSRLDIPAKLRLNIHHVPSAPGHLMIAVFANESDFMKTPLASKRVISTPGVMTAEFNLPLGEYSVLIFQDQSGNGILSRNRFGIPTEPWTTSSRTGRTKGKPTWAQTRFVMADLLSVREISF